MQLQTMLRSMAILKLRWVVCGGFFQAGFMLKTDETPQDHSPWDSPYTDLLSIVPPHKRGKIEHLAGRVE